MVREERSRNRDGTNIMYANTINGVLEYHSVYFLYNNKNQILVKYSLLDGQLE